jgi:hypothetical protein
VHLHASADVQARLETLADKSTAGQLSAEERAEYATAVAAIEFISVRQAKARRLVRERAGDRCEYCGMRQAQQSFPFFHVDHIIA